MPLERSECWTEFVDLTNSQHSDALKWEGLFSEVDVVFDCVGGDEGAAHGELLSEGGTLVHYGLLSGKPLPSSFQEQRPDVCIDYFRLRRWVLAASRTTLEDAFASVFGLICQGEIHKHSGGAAAAPGRPRRKTIVAASDFR